MIYLEPANGPTPIVRFIDSAKHHLDMNYYYLSDPNVNDAISNAVRRGVIVKIVIDEKPFGISKRLLRTEITNLRQTGATIHAAPARFEGQDGHYSFDHAKYAVTSHHALIETGNIDKTAFRRDRDYIEITNNPTTIQYLNGLFYADFNNTPIEHRIPQLVVSPHATHKILAVINQPGPIDIEIEELGYDQPILEALARKGTQARIITTKMTSAAEELQRAGVKIKILHSPYIHAKIILGNQYDFLGSENFSKTSLSYNREVGTFTYRHQAMTLLKTTFDQDWQKARNAE